MQAYYGGGASANKAPFYGRSTRAASDLGGTVGARTSSTPLHRSRRAWRACIVALALLGALLGGVTSASADPPVGANVPIGIRLFPADNPWNQDISALPADPNSSAYLSSVGLDEPLHPDFGTVWDGAPNGIPPPSRGVPPATETVTS